MAPSPPCIYNGDSRYNMASLELMAGATMRVGNINRQYVATLLHHGADS